MGNDPRIDDLIDPTCDADVRAAEQGKVRICRLPDGQRFSAESTEGIYSHGRGVETGPVQGVVKCGVTGPGEGVMVLFDGEDQRREVNPHWVVTPSWGASVGDES